MKYLSNITSGAGIESSRILVEGNKKIGQESNKWSMKIIIFNNINEL